MTEICDEVHNEIEARGLISNSRIFLIYACRREKNSGGDVGGGGGGGKKTS